MSALAVMAPLEAAADCLACCFGAPGIDACEYAQATRRSGVICVPTPPVMGRQLERNNI
jgi:hypothetical protein